jgi:hypothetical protein
MQLSIKTNFPDVQKKLQRLRSDIADKALPMAVNRTMDQARTAMQREITGTYNLKAAYVRQRLAIRRAVFKGNSLSFTASLLGTGKRSANLVAFLARKAPNNGRKGGPQVGFRIRKGGAISRVPGAFIGNKGRTVFLRVPGTKMASRRWSGKHGEQIKPVQTVDVPQMFNQRRINAAVVRVLQQRFPEVFEQQVRFYASRMR